MIFTFRRKDAPWEVVDNKFVDPVPTYHGSSALDIADISQTDIKGTYIFDLNQKDGRGYRGTHDLLRAVDFSRQQLLSEAEKKGFNVLLIESWQLTIFRRAKQHRIEVRYNGRPALCVGTVPSRTHAPHIGILHA
ncbi:hypothetical protein FA15DRAFT_594843 [Coprinopsis marcescibilis]|uniref:Uncharacterized protein n=1 Tax=Coprinopsis marcescibilis TaxID=230819 RepID=A0A5C3KTF7_COPMA|nr:hypothetical protein FA15DRAFT_594843 [Coprinopsis marcescibilis]